MNNQYILAYDVGTSGVKTVLLGLDGEVLASRNADYPVLTPKLSWVEQNPDDYWQAIIKTTREVVVENKIAKEQIVALVFSTQSMGIIPIDKEGNILYNNITWLDGRAEEQAEMVNAAIGQEMLGGKDVLCKLLWLKMNMPDIFNNTEYFMNVNCYLRYRATGVIKSELTGASSYGLDNQTNSYISELFDAVGVGTEKLPAIINSSDLAGKLTKQAAEELNLAIDTPVYGGCDDVQAAALGAGTVREGEAHIYLGSSAWLCVTTAKDNELINGTATVKSADPKMNVAVGVTQSAGMTVDWTVDRLYKIESEEGRAFEVIEEEIEEIPPGSENLIVTPWIFGEYCPITSETVRMTMFNLTNMHSRAHIINGTFEGIGYNLRWIKENYKQDFGIDIKSLRVIGGGANNDHWMQELADLMQVKIEVTKDVRYAGARGAAICALVGMGIYDGFNEAGKLVKVEKEFYPRKKNLKIYEKLYSEYRNIYHALKDSYERINSSDDM